MQNNVLKLTGITKSYGSKRAVDGINMTVPQGEIYGLIGRNGAGKTTVMRMITSLCHADSGEIELFGATNGKELREARERMGCVIENPSLYPNLNAVQNLEYYQRLKGIPNKQIVQKTLEIVGLAEVGKKKFKNYSLGMKQRLGIGLALLNNPDLLILDEPLNGLDPMGIVEMRELIKSLSKERQITILICSHLLTELSLVATRYGIIENGRMVKELTAEELADACQSSLSIQVSDIPKALSVIETQLGTRNYKVIGEQEIRLFEYMNESHVVNQALVSGGVNVLGISKVEDNLEAYFMELVKEEK
ncbi:MAG: ABC transporter ATP-binding protein [Turicibacter sp.]|nr:ABC transporter ATP-binding protein [Turicibacter sp.]